MSFQDELRAKYKEKEQYVFDMSRIESAADEILKIVKKDMLYQAEIGAVSEKKMGILGIKTRRYVWSEIKILEYKDEVNTPHVEYYEGDRNEKTWYAHDKKERLALYDVLSQKCVDENIKLEKSQAASMYCIKFMAEL